MPHLFFPGASEETPSHSAPPPAHPPPPSAPAQAQDNSDASSDKENVWGRTWKQMGNWLKKEDENETQHQQQNNTDGDKEELSEKVPCEDTTSARPAHAVIPGVPRPITFRRQDSERRERLYPHEPDHEERRATSADRRLGTSYERKVSPCPLPPQLAAASPPRRSLLDLVTSSEAPQHTHQHEFASTAGTIDGQHSDQHDQDLETHSHYDWAHHDILHHSEQLTDALDELQIQSELEAKWILNLSMHFRDHSDREKFFVTYAEEPNKWRRVTVSCDYRFAPHDSLEADLKSLHYQRDKSARIYEAIRDSLPQIQFYPTVTNLKLETSDGRLHVHVTEDVNEIIQYPYLSSVAHLELPEYAERSIEFDCHMSGFVYKVKTSNGGTFIKKEIPGPEAVEEFIYEINALSSLRGAPSVVQLEGLVINERGQIKGILLNYCEQGALVDLIYDFRHTDRLTWERRLRWSRQIVRGLAEIHEAGFVQGDFTLSNIVVCQEDDAHIIDINRRGCPIGWEPPELSKLIQAGHRISMYIGVKSDIFQLGMVLWALAEQQDEPERQERPLRFRNPEDVPDWYREIVEICLNPVPRERLLAKELLAKFPPQQVENTLQTPAIAVEDVTVGNMDPEHVMPQQSSGVVNGTEGTLSPIYGSTPANIETGVEYLVTSLDVDKRADSVADSYGQPEVETEKSNEISTDATTEHTATLNRPPPEDDTQYPEQPNGANLDASTEQTAIIMDETPSKEEIQSLGQQAQPSSLIRELHLAALAQDAAPTPEEPPAFQEPSADVAQEPRESVPAIPSPTVAPSSVESPPIISPLFSLGNPPIATISPLPQGELSKSESSPPEHARTAFTAIFPPPPIEAVADPVSEKLPGDTTSPAVEIGSPPLATLSPPPPTTSVPPPQEASLGSSPSVSIGNPPLATFSPPPVPSPLSIEQDMPAVNDVVAHEHNTEITSTSGMDTPRQQDPRVDELSTSTRETLVSPLYVLAPVESSLLRPTPGTQQENDRKMESK